MHVITVLTKPATIPEFFEVDLTGLEIGHSIDLCVNVPEGVRVVTRDKNPRVALIAAPTVVREPPPKPPPMRQPRYSTGSGGGRSGSAGYGSGSSRCGSSSGCRGAGWGCCSGSRGGGKAPAPAKK